MEGKIGPGAGWVCNASVSLCASVLLRASSVVGMPESEWVALSMAVPTAFCPFHEPRTSNPGPPSSFLTMGQPLRAWARF